MKKVYFLLAIMYIPLVNSTYGQNDTSKILLVHKRSNVPVLYILDGLKINKDVFVGLGIEEYCIKKIRVDKDFSYTDSISNFKGAIHITTKLLLVINGESIYKSKYKRRILSKVNYNDIQSIQMVEKNDAIKKFGKRGKCGAIVVKTK